VWANGGPHFGVATSGAKRRDEQKKTTREQEEVKEEEAEDEVKTSTDRESRLPWAAAESSKEAQRESPASGPEGVGGRSYRVINSRDLLRTRGGEEAPTSLALSNSSANCT